MVIQSKKVWLADQFVPAAIEVNDSRITAILPYGAKDVDDDYGDKRIVPGFMDIHCHGAYEFDTNDANEDGLRYWAEHIVSEGVTSFDSDSAQSVVPDFPGVVFRFFEVPIRNFRRQVFLCLLHADE